MNRLMQIYQSFKFGFRLGKMKARLVANVQRFFKGKKHGLIVLDSVNNEDSVKWITVQEDKLVSLLSGVPSNFPMVMVFAISDDIGSFIVNQGFMDSDVGLQKALLDHEIGHIKEGHLFKGSEVKKVVGGLVVDLEAEIAADRHVQDKGTFISFLDSCMSRPEYAAVLPWLQLRKNALQSQM